MRMYTQITTTIILLFAAAGAIALPMSIAFNTTSNNFGGAANTNPAGEPSNIDGLQLPGQAGPWQDLIVGNGRIGTAGNFLVSPSITAGGITFTLDTGVEGYETFNDPGGSDNLRQAVVFLRSGRNTSLNWSITGLLNNALYDIIMFGQEGPSNPSLFSINGHDAGNGIGAAVDLDEELDGNFTGVLAAGGTITGQFALGSNQTFAGWSGLQVAQVPTAATLALFGLGLAGLGFSRRKKA